jgi:hypothetical protein
MPRRPTPKVIHQPPAPMTTPAGVTSKPTAKAPAKPQPTPIPNGEPINPLSGTGQRPNPAPGSHPKTGWIGPSV